MKFNSSIFVGLASVAALATGCVERRTVYVPTYTRPPGAYPAQPVYAYPGQVATQPPPLVNQYPNGGPGTAPPPTPDPNATNPGGPPPPDVVVTQPPPAPQVEVVPMAPGPEYAWTPGYWGWNHGWVWIGGSWVIRPRVHAIWIGPRWVHRGHGYVWERGHWR